MSKSTMLRIVLGITFLIFGYIIGTTSDDLSFAGKKLEYVAVPLNVEDIGTWKNPKNNAIAYEKLLNESAEKGLVFDHMLFDYDVIVFRKK